MRLLEMIESLGGRLGIIERVSARKTSKAPVKIRTRVVTLAELQSEIKADEVRALAETPAELTVAFEKIFEAAGIQSPESGWNVDKLGQLLRTDPFLDQPREAIQRRVLEALGTEEVDPETLVKDAIARDQALDAFEKFAQRKMMGRIAGYERKSGQIGTRIDELQKERARLEALVSEEWDRWREWQRRKRAHEQELAWAIGHLIDRPVITTEDDPR